MTPEERRFLDKAALSVAPAILAYNQRQVDQGAWNSISYTAMATEAYEAAQAMLHERGLQ